MKTLPKDKIVRYGNNKFELQEDGKRIAIFDTYENALLYSLAPEMFKFIKKVCCKSPTILKMFPPHVDEIGEIGEINDFLIKQKSLAPDFVYHADLEDMSLFERIQRAKPKDIQIKSLMASEQNRKHEGHYPGTIADGKIVTPAGSGKRTDK